MSYTAKDVQALREATGAGMMDCKKALEEAQGNMESATEILRKKGLAAAAKRAGKAASEGAVGSYIHMGGKIGVLVEVNCETDFVSRNERFQAIVKDLAMHIAAAAPLYVSRDEVPEALIAKEREIFMAQAKESGKPENILVKMVEGKADKYLKEICLLDQPFVKDPDKTIQQYLAEAVAEIRENIKVRRFARFVLGEGLEKKQGDFAAEVAAAAGKK